MPMVIALESMKHRAMITWELAKDKYGITEYFLLILSQRFPNICDEKKCMVVNLWS